MTTTPFKSPPTGHWSPAGEPGVWTRHLQFGLDCRLHIPADAGRIWDSTLAPGAEWKPLMCRFGFVVVEQDGAFHLATPFETRLAFHQFEFRRLEDRLEMDWSVTLGSCISDPSQKTVEPGWHWQSYSTQESAVGAFRQWMEQSFPQTPRHTPGWLTDMSAIVLIELWTGTGKIKHTFAELCDLMEAMNRAQVPRNTLVNFWGWFAPFDTLYPEYWPARELGGEDGLDRVFETARKHGYRLMPHLNSHGIDGRLPDYKRLAAYQARDRHGTLLGWREKGEPSIEYMRPNALPWRKFLCEKVSRLVARYPFDAFFNDQYAVLIDDPECDYATAWPDYCTDFQKACPETLICSEVFHERVFDLSLWQHWGTDYCGLTPRPDIPSSDILGVLFKGRFAAMGHMGMPSAVDCPDCWPSFYFYPNAVGKREALERATRWNDSVGCVRTVRVNFRDHGLDPVSLALIQGKPL